MGKPFVSIIIPALNEEKFLPQLLESLTKQSDKNFEVIIVDGRSKDKTVEAAKTFAKTLPQLTITIADYANLPYQRNFGAKKAKGTWFMFLDADNVMMPYAVERMNAFIIEQKPSFFSSWIRPDSNFINDALLALFGNLLLEGSILVKRPFSPGPFTAVSREVFERVGGYTEGLKWGEDVDFSTKVQKKGYTFSIIREVLYIWSMRRLRHEGKLKFIQQAAKAAFYVLLTNRALTNGYEMGGQMYGKKKQRINKTVAQKLAKTIQKLMKEVFE
jgi:glycosyltransferase involved in cell wall biosynthesis